MDSKENLEKMLSVLTAFVDEASEAKQRKFTRNEACAYSCMLALSYAIFNVLKERGKLPHE